MRFHSGWNRCSNERKLSVCEFDAVKQQIARYCAFAAGSEMLMAQMPCFDPLWIRRELRRCAQACTMLRIHLQFPDDDLVDISAHVQRARKGMTLRPGELFAIVVSSAPRCGCGSFWRSVTRTWKSCASCGMPCLMSAVWKKTSRLYLAGWRGV